MNVYLKALLHAALITATTSGVAGFAALAIASDDKATKDNDLQFGASHITPLESWGSDASVDLAYLETKESGIQLSDSEFESDRWTFDDIGNPVRYEKDYNKDGRSDEIYTWQYDKAGNLTRYVFDMFADGEVVQVETWKYDKHSNVIRHEMYSTASADDKWVVDYKYDNHDQLVSAQLNCDQDGLTKTAVNYQFEHKGNQLADDQNQPAGHRTSTPRS